MQYQLVFGLMNIQQRVSEIFEAEAAAIRAIRIDETYDEAVEILQSCAGKVLTTGMGKAGHVARKFAGTLSSTGTPTVFIHPAEAAHGDLGMIANNDCLVAFSTSGKTREVLEVVQMGRRVGLAKVIAITSHPDSELRELSDVTIDMGQISEPCPLHLTPTASVAVMLAISDAIALVLMELRGFSIDEFGLRHHGGYLGRKARLDNT